MRKKKIYDKCRLYVITPSQWLMDKVGRSILHPAVAKARVIPNGVDQNLFCPGSKAAARAKLGIQANEKVVMFAANGIRKSIWKDYGTMRAALRETADILPEMKVRLLAVGENAPEEKIGSAVITFVPHKAPDDLPLYYRAADIYLHAARAENFPNVIIEALSCGTPVIATAVGGIPEQIKGLNINADRSGLNQHSLDSATGILTPKGDVVALSNAIVYLLQHPEMVQQLSITAAHDARRFNLESIGEMYMAFFSEVMTDWKNYKAGL
jgi:glycosyltransferase involved in cell wall biosynthesis